MTRKSYYISTLITFISFSIHVHSQGTWENVISPTNKFLKSVHFVDSLYGWAVGDSGIILHTSNGGNQWQLQNSSTTNRIEDVYFITRNNGLAASWNISNFPFGTYLLKTTDGGQNWTGNTYRDDNIFIRCITFLDTLTGWMGGSPHALVKTTDGGITWNQADIDSTVLAFFPVNNIKFYNNIYGYACGGAFEVAGVIWKTIDGGDHWFALEPALAPPDPIHQLHLFDELNVIGVGGDFEFTGVGVLRTTDGGNFWEYESIGLPGIAFDLEFRTDYEAWSTRGFPGGLIYSLDSGTTWQETTVPTNSRILDIFFVDSLHGFAVGEHGTILKYKPPFIIPVELTSFTAAVTNNDISLKWSTATELNNKGFNVHRKAENGAYTSVGFVQGFGTTTDAQSYYFTDSRLDTGIYTYRLMQIDFNGNFEYSNEISVEVRKPFEYVLEQNYPNPFNPGTVINYSIPQDGIVTIEIFNLLGEKLATLLDEIQVAGRYEINFDASNLSSGIYVYGLKAGKFNVLKKMLLIK
jgi:photosystem II stability/assembly factor-like uncharacterized protein